MSLEQLEPTIITQGAGLPDLRIDLEDSDGDDVDLSGYSTFAAKIIDGNGQTTTINTVTGTTTGFQVALTDEDTEALEVGEYEVHATGMSAGRTRVGKCRLIVTKGY